MAAFIGLRVRARAVLGRKSGNFGRDRPRGEEMVRPNEQRRVLQLQVVDQLDGVKAAVHAGRRGGKGSVAA